MLVRSIFPHDLALARKLFDSLSGNRRRFPQLRATIGAGANASVLPPVSVASLVGFGAVVAVMPAFADVRNAGLSIGGGPLVSLAVATNVLAALTGSASGGLMMSCRHTLQEEFADRPQYDEYAYLIGAWGGA
jgi:H+/gluconate symporter-like permease